ncbi:hypothetical protein MKX07_004909 [Trichoderma sp. CBMAI-0711]|nr:hypothetical protein MKX07_004909 [Trichoderma sp. CBMAI-0711]
MVSHLATRISLHSLSLLLLFSPTSLAATNLIPHKPPARLLARAPPTSSFRDFSAIVVAAQCRPGEFTCNAGCMPQRAECCPDGLGYCKQGYACVVDGCCPIGHTCGDEVTCDLGEVPCGEKLCMPEGAADGNGSTTTGRTSTGSIAETTTTTVRGQSTASDTDRGADLSFHVAAGYLFRVCRQHNFDASSDLIPPLSPRRVIKCVTCNDDHFVRFSLFFFSSRISNDDFN